MKNSFISIVFIKKAPNCTYNDIQNDYFSVNKTKNRTLLAHRCDREPISLKTLWKSHRWASMGQMLRKPKNYATNRKTDTRRSAKGSERLVRAGNSYRALSRTAPKTALL